jgi:hypothetical protein
MQRRAESQKTLSEELVRANVNRGSLTRSESARHEFPNGSAKRRLGPWHADWPFALREVRCLILQELWTYFTLRRERAKKLQPTAGKFLSTWPCRVFVDYSLNLLAQVAELPTKLLATLRGHRRQLLDLSLE